MNTYVHFPSNCELSSWVSLIWEIQGNENINETILPQGAVEMVFNFSNMVGLLPNISTFIKAPRCFIQGIHTHNVNVKYSGVHHLFGVRIKPFIVKKLINILPNELNNQAIDLTLIKPYFNSLWHQLAEANSFEERVNIIKTFFSGLAINKCERSMALCQYFYDPDLSKFRSVNTLADNVCYSTRQLNRKVNEFYGMSTEELIMYKRYMSSVLLIHTNKMNLTEIAHACGFYDQAHFNHVFKYFSALNPTSYIKNKSGLPFHLFE